MQTTIHNPCTRCGRERVISRTWKEDVKTYSGTSSVVHVDTMCPDPACQKLVDDQLAVQKEKRMVIAQNQKRRVLERQKRIQK
jgi:hypothetical protein